MQLLERAHFLHRAWRHRLRSDKLGIAFLRSRDLRGKTALDLGANRGVYSYWLHRQVGPEGQVIALEPQPELAEYLDDLRRCFGLSRLKIVNRAVSSTSGVLQLVRPADHWGGASFHGEPSDNADLLDVGVVTLDELFRDEPPPTPVAFIKCDVEGHQAEAFRGAEGLLRGDRPDILVEVGDPDATPCDTFELLASFDYSGYCMHDDGYIPVSRYARVEPQLHRKAKLNFAFVPRERSGQMPISRLAAGARAAA